MKDHIGNKLKGCTEYHRAKMLVDDYMDYYNNERYQWELAKLSPNEYYQFCVTGEYPLNEHKIPSAFFDETFGTARIASKAFSEKKSISCSASFFTGINAIS